MRQGLQSGLRLLRRSPHGPEPSVPPPNLPPARVLWVPGRGEMFLREQEGPAGALPVLLLHGWTVSADITWFAAYPALAGRHPVIAIDHRGHGRGIRAEEPFSLEACADDAAALLELLGVRQVIVAGYSMGGAVALLLCQRHPKLVAGAVLGGTASEWRATPRQRLMWRCLGVFEYALQLGTGDGFVERYLHYAVGRSPEVADLRAWVGGELKRGYPRDIAEAGRDLARFDARPFIGTIDVPCCSIVTERDRLVRPREQWALAEALGAPVVTVDGDHDAPLVRPERFASAVTHAVETVARAASATGRPATIEPAAPPAEPGPQPDQPAPAGCHRSKEARMEVVHVDPSAGELPTSLRPHFQGEARLQPLESPFPDGPAVFAVHFDPGGRTRPHVHRHGQLLHVASGEGIVADASGRRVVRAGDVVAVTAGEWHWHGATPRTPMTHLTVQMATPDETNWDVDEQDWANDYD